MRQALKESLLKRKTGSRHERAKAYTDGDTTTNAEPDDYDVEKDAPGEPNHDVKKYGMAPKEEENEEYQEEKEEENPGDFRDEDYWRDEQKSFMKGRDTAKKPKKSGSFIGKLVTGGGKKTTNKKIDPPFQTRSVKGSAQTIG
jgi:hypothetical protein